MTWNEEIEARGEARGLARGQQRMFLALLEQRFGSLSEQVQARVRSASTDELAAWTNAFFRATSPEALLGL